MAVVVVMFPALEGRGYGTSNIVVVNVAMKGWVLVIVKLTTADVSTLAAEALEREVEGFGSKGLDVAVSKLVVSLSVMVDWLLGLKGVDILVAEERASVDDGI